MYYWWFIIYIYFYVECLFGYFGMECRKCCSGKCENNELCDYVIGVCLIGC